MDIALEPITTLPAEPDGRRDRAALDHAPDGFCMLDPQGRILDVNETFVQRSGYSRPRLLTMKFGQLEASMTLAETASRLATVQREGHDLFEALYRARDGSVWYAEVNAVWWPGDGGRVFLYTRDITRRRRAEAELRASEARLRSALEAAHTVAWEVDLERGELLQVGPAASLFDLPEGTHHLSLAACLESVHPDDREKVLAAVTAGGGGEPIEVEFRVPLRGGGERWVAGSGALARDESGRATLIRGTARDVTEHHRLRASLAQADRLSTMGLLAAGLAHEINNPLASALYHLGTLASDLPLLLEALAAPAAPPPGACREQLAGALYSVQEALGGAERIRELTRGLGAFSRAEEGEAQPIDLEVPLRQALSLARNEIKYRARLVTDFGEALPQVLATGGKLAQTFLNLLLNAAQAIDARGPDANEIRVRTWLEDESVCAEVRDSGSGIAPEHLPRVFEPFFTTKPVGVGSGLGLSIGRAIVAGFCGQMTCESQPGQGTSFVVRLPALPAVAVAGDTPRPASTGGRVLVVDDDAGIRRGLERMLAKAHEVMAVESVAAAQRVLAADADYDVVLCDLMMPGQSGTELHAWLGAEHPELARRLVFLSGGSLSADVDRYVAHTGAGLLEKPFNGQDVRRAVDALVAAHRRSRPAPRCSPSQGDAR